MTTYEKAPAGTTVAVANETILPVGRFGIIVVGLNQLGTMTRSMKMVAVAYARQDFGETCCPPVK